MSMSIGGPDSGEDRGIMSEINTTPLVDIMLVLLIIFLITIPVITKNVPPRALAVARGRQVVKEGWATRLRAIKSLSKKKAQSVD